MPRLNYEKDREINKDELEKEWLNQSNLVGNYGKELAKAKRKKADLWEEVKVIKAELITECKQDNSKATGPQLEAYYRTHDRHKKAKAKLINAEYEIDLIETAYDTLRFQKKVAMQEVRKIQQDEMFAETDVDYTREAKRKAARKRQKKRLTK